MPDEDSQLIVSSPSVSVQHLYSARASTSNEDWTPAGCVAQLDRIAGHCWSHGVVLKAPDVPEAVRTAGIPRSPLTELAHRLRPAGLLQPVVAGIMEAALAGGRGTSP
ncbi:hypothetical protein [Arthrobacter sp. VKM Ac-2550]|uniref:hypothetical protein n=1 Tax=Crystallibacter permensis TaxID=1938888 RepID=UPI002225DF75|nr:hypothetical protein [Arthrobacter sp. VKM Ac-2550]